MLSKTRQKASGVNCKAVGINALLWKSPPPLNWLFEPLGSDAEPLTSPVKSTCSHRELGGSYVPPTCSHFEIHKIGRVTQYKRTRNNETIDFEK